MGRLHTSREATCVICRSLYPTVSRTSTIVSRSTTISRSVPRTDISASCCYFWNETWMYCFVFQTVPLQIPYLTILLTRYLHHTRSHSAILYRLRCATPCYRIIQLYLSKSVSLCYDGDKERRSQSQCLFSTVCWAVRTAARH